jgi:hypothetical protein
MPNQDYYKVFSTNFLPEISKVYCIITGVELESYGKLFSEYYIFIPKHKIFFGLKAEAQKNKIFEIEIDLEYLFNDCKKMAIGKLDNYLYEQLKDKNFMFYLNAKIELNEVPKFEIIDIVNGMDFKSIVSEIGFKTNSTQLKNEIKYIRDNEKLFIKKIEL